MLTIKRLNQYYAESHTLWDIDLHVPKGECTVLMGRNGVGKTTLLQCIMGLLATKNGHIQLSGKDISHCRAEERVHLGIGYVPQGRQIFPMLTVWENLAIGLPARTKGDRTVPDFIYELFPVLHQMQSRYGGDLSGGQQQQLAIARALVVNPSLLILDEPTEGIQPNVVHEIGDIIQMLNQQYGLTVLLVEQKLPFARKVGDHFCLLDRGRNVATGAMATLNKALITEYLTV
ncbi:urea ABC transporter ATP-binding protein [Photobacterium kishitanii]|uniref:Urea ABC transporter ATP-binding subunit UrtE n=1 Tax=Photobacterium kishitanii TaxID=318456 RepID=A0AAX0YTW9_9GAMM|nr:urea ABC transporter ATP-binding subunit UrtE [Photobacterium kishitanii]KJG56480.1 urea ABC transporter ATP-binding protein [Photobacterium kishitanii]KJG60977.1 urea ABC transporter ATP-binding protein [Photobacterium kishitanii]KJG65723.1 urea ABC transporter ATP-binding protein [Photobacterium kishitanii]KJG70303.1 urea ABC transporter ATP-binding protein [Photobacterium kishitanii]PSW60229.1 urea ABC transporter ATP-binding subunit UrtE [Photobacterium kishitanii]